MRLASPRSFICQIEHVTLWPPERNFCHFSLAYLADNMSVYSDSSIEVEVLSVPLSHNDHETPEQVQSDQDIDEYLTREFVQFHNTSDKDSGDEYRPAKPFKGKQKTPIKKAKQNKAPIKAKNILQSLETSNTDEQSDGEYDYQQHRDTLHDTNEAEEEEEVNMDQSDESQEQLRYSDLRPKRHLLKCSS
jgi:hypothetical protein